MTVNCLFLLSFCCFERCKGLLVRFCLYLLDAEATVVGEEAGTGDGAGDGNDTNAVDGVVLPLHICIRPTEASSAFLQSEKLDLHFFLKLFMES